MPTALVEQKETEAQLSLTNNAAPKLQYEETQDVKIKQSTLYTMQGPL